MSTLAIFLMAIASFKIAITVGGLNTKMDKSLKTYNLISGTMLIIISIILINKFGFNIAPIKMLLALFIGIIIAFIETCIYIKIKEDKDNGKNK